MMKKIVIVFFLIATVTNSKAQIKIGDAIPSITLKSNTNNEVDIISFKGKYVLVDFWASWCGPCRKENPNMVSLYKEFHSKGLNIIGVSLDKEAKAWKEAIAKDQLNWVQVSNLKFWDEPIARQYNVESIPATFILDATGKVIAKDLRGADLRNKIASLLAK